MSASVKLMLEKNKLESSVGIAGSPSCGVTYSLRESLEIFRGLKALHDPAIEINLYQARGGDFVIGHAVRVDEEMAFLARHARRDVVVDEVVHAEMMDQAVAGGEVHARVPFFA